MYIHSPIGGGCSVEDKYGDPIRGCTVKDVLAALKKDGIVSTYYITRMAIASLEAAPEDYVVGIYGY